MRFFALFFMLSIPALAALAFDLWLAYGESMDFNKPMEFTSVGWLWLRYAEDNYNLMRQTIDPATWSGVISPILSQKTVLVALFPVYLAIPILLIMKIFGWGSFEGNGWLSKLGRSKKKAGFSYQTNLDTPRKKMKYNRR
ncbi:MAG: hypothetical protein HYS17_00665 [Micavibrio aeruginosavorus]|uniref:Conjugal transfer protein TraG n=1 Tax=Micavibrio aeruginosavorus TaxID=349221 RepID=A0A7T5R2G3_9BACT|nr:MAG: hypothetical protein HYS17_00665 [Micavibrio aeruginosavorus]